MSIIEKSHALATQFNLTQGTIADLLRASADYDKRELNTTGKLVLHGVCSIRVLVGLDGRYTIRTAASQSLRQYYKNLPRSTEKDRQLNIGTNSCLQDKE